MDEKGLGPLGLTGVLLGILRSALRGQRAALRTNRAHRCAGKARRNLLSVQVWTGSQSRASLVGEHGC